ncbi:MAG: disulfide bond formation protein B [Rhodoferax sp.]|nr:disulfide bond formation protein B [Rhodoferax sp.]
MIAVWHAGLTAASTRKSLQISGSVLLVLLACAGAFVAARQELAAVVPARGGVLRAGPLRHDRNLPPLKRALLMIFRGGGDCTKVDWTFLGGSIANWSFLWFGAMALVGSALVWRQARHR